MKNYVHAVPGRLRVKNPLLKGNPSRGQEVQALLENCDGIESCTVNPVTGSVVVYYDCDSLQTDQILQILKKNGYFDESGAVTMDHYFQNVVSAAGGAFSRAAFSWAVGRAFEGSGLAILAALI
jgi:hypothetical protein